MLLYCYKLDIKYVKKRLHKIIIKNKSPETNREIVRLYSFEISLKKRLEFF